MQTGERRLGMAFLSQLRKLFGQRAERDDGLYFYVRCDRCAEIVRVRLNPSTDLQQDFGEQEDRVSGYFVRKVVVDAKCFRPIETKLWFDAGRRIRSREISGGTFVSEAVYRAAAQPTRS